MSNQNIEQKKAQIRQRYKGIDQSLLEVIPAEVPKKLNEDNSHKRVAVYARVSTDNVEQTSSYELQKNHYEDFVNHRPGWELIEIYADEGISGTSLKHRDNFDEALISAVNHNGDSDSTGAITGNILGTYLGIEGIPEKYISNLELKEILEKVANRLMK